MNLPGDKRCGDCVHIRRCNAIFGHMATDERCDWYPSKFRAAVQSPNPTGITYRRTGRREKTMKRPKRKNAAAVALGSLADGPG